MSPGILKYIHRKHVLYRNLLIKEAMILKLNTPNIKINYFCHPKLMAERQYYYDKFELANSNINKTWQTSNTIIIAGPSHNNDKQIKEKKFMIK